MTSTVPDDCLHCGRTTQLVYEAEPAGDDQHNVRFLYRTDAGPGWVHGYCLREFLTVQSATWVDARLRELSAQRRRERWAWLRRLIRR